MKGWSTEEMKDKANSLLEEDTEEMRKWRGLNQSEMDICWKKLAERMEEEVLEKYTRSRTARTAGMEACAKTQHIQDTKVERTLLTKNLRLVQRQQPEASVKSMHEGSTEQEEMRRQQRMKVMKDMSRKIDQKEGWMPRTDGRLLNCWRQTAKRRGSIQKKKKKICKNGSIGWKTKKEDDGRNMEEMHQQRVNLNDQSAEGSAGLLHKITKPTTWRGGTQIQKKEEDANMLDR